eukprot:1206823-Alexandrium_andersonii.AAC.1
MCQRKELPQSSCESPKQAPAREPRAPEKAPEPPKRSLRRFHGALPKLQSSRVGSTESVRSPTESSAERAPPRARG